jgi:SAM-dependent methyltransferase
MTPRSCILCAGSHLEPLFDLGTLPLGFPVEVERAADGGVWQQPLELVLCRDCLLAQTVHLVPAGALRSENFYASERSRLVTQHDAAFATMMPARLGLRGDASILEVGCGDGSLLDRLRDAGFQRLVGLEPSIHRDKAYGYPVVEGELDAATVQRLRADTGAPDLIVANYVLELIPHLGPFMANLAALAAPGGRIVVEVPYLIDFMRTFRLDGFAHLRCGWFTARALVGAFRTAGLTVVDIEHDPTYRGGTLRATAAGAVAGAASRTVSELLAAEEAALTPSAIAAFRDRIAAQRDAIASRLRQLRDGGLPVYGYGGGLKASTLVNWLRLTCRDVAWTADLDPNKQGRLIPVANIPIRPVDDLPERSGPAAAVLMLALDHAIEVEELLRRRLAPGSLIVYAVPESRTVIVQ